MSERIIAAALFYNAVICTLPAPARHGDIIHAIANSVDRTLWPINGPQGFITDTGRFVDRKEAMRIAVLAGQVEAGDVPDLYSEDLW